MAKQLFDLYNGVYSQGHIKGDSKFSRSLLSTDTDSLTSYLAKHLDTKDDAHHPVYDYSHYIVKIKSLASCMCIVAYTEY